MWNHLSCLPLTPWSDSPFERLFAPCRRCRVWGAGKIRWVMRLSPVVTLSIINQNLKIIIFHHNIKRSSSVTWPLIRKVLEYLEAVEFRMAATSLQNSNFYLNAKILSLTSNTAIVSLEMRGSVCSFSKKCLSHAQL